MKTVFLTGGTGTMGFPTLLNLLKHDDIKVKLLVRPKTKHKKYKKLLNRKNLEVIYGDLLDYDSIKKGVIGADYVLHIGGMVSPLADYYPALTLKTNIEAAENICKAIIECGYKDNMKLCYIGSVAETGNRSYPTHWGRCGDKVKASLFDNYSVSKIKAERIIVESGIKNFVIMRQSGILYPEILTKIDPIIFHVPLNHVHEWCTIEDAATLMENFVTFDLPKTFYGKFYNISSGPEYRLTNFEIYNYMFQTLGIGSVKDLFEPNWFGTQNFHGHFYTDADKLDNFLHFRAFTPVKDYLKKLIDNSKFYYKIIKYLPFKKLICKITKLYLKSLAYTKDYGLMYFIKTNNKEKINAYWGGIDKYKKIPLSWNNFKFISYDKNYNSSSILLEHGYDDSKDTSEIDINDMKSIAKFRNGECLSTNMIKGDLKTKLNFKCNNCNKEFCASPALIALGGHFCPNCDLIPNPN